MPRRKKTASQRARDKTKRFVKRTKKRVAKSAKRTKKKLVRRAKKTKRQITRSVKRTRKRVKRKTKRIRKAANKRLRTWKRNRAKAIRRQYRRKNLTGEEPLLGGYTSNRKRASADRAFLPDFGNDDGASKPGEPPKKRTGRGQSAIKAELISHKTKQRDITARTYVDKKIAAYMAMWEHRKDGAGRPFLEPSYKNNKKFLAADLSLRLKRKLSRTGRRLK